MNKSTPAASGAAPAVTDEQILFACHGIYLSDFPTSAAYDIAIARAVLAAFASREADMQEAKDLIEHLDIENHWLRHAALASPHVAPAPEPTEGALINLARLCGATIAGPENADREYAVFSRRELVAFASMCRGPAPVAPQDDARDAARLDFVLENSGFLLWKTRDGSIRQCQLMTQNEDEEYVYLSGEHRYFSTPRDAIDAAIVLSTPAAKPTEPTLPTQGDAK